MKKLAKGEPVSGRKGERANIVDFKEPIEETTAANSMPCSGSPGSGIRPQAR